MRDERESLCSQPLDPLISCHPQPGMNKLIIHVWQVLQWPVYDLHMTYRIQNAVCLGDCRHYLRALRLATKFQLANMHCHEFITYLYASNSEFWLMNNWKSLFAHSRNNCCTLFYLTCYSYWKEHDVRVYRQVTKLKVPMTEFLIFLIDSTQGSDLKSEKNFP